MGLNSMYSDNNWSEHPIKRGLFGKKYYIIRRNDVVGLFSLVNTHLGHIKYAIDRGYIPVIDMQNYSNVYLPEEKLGEYNAWDLFFEQPLNVALEDAFDAKRIVLSSGFPIEPRPDDDCAFFNNVNGRLDEWRTLAHKYIRVKKSLLEEIDDEYNHLVEANDRILGTHIRGTDYVARRPYGHPIQPDLENVIAKCHEMMEKNNCNKIFVGTEDEQIAIKMKKEFGDAYITNSHVFTKYEENKWAPEFKSDRENDEYLQGKEYLATMVMLSRCNCFVGGRTSGTVGIMLMTDGFEDSYIYCIGRYGMEGTEEFDK